jgi:nucleoside-diphosphate kinase
MNIQQTLVLIKPDGVQKQLIGEIIKRFENSGLKISGLKMTWPDEELARKHYPLDLEWAKSAFEKTRKSAQEDNRKIQFSNYEDFGKTLQNWLIAFITESPIIAMVLQGPNAVTLVRKIIGATEPSKAEEGTIRGDLASEESYEKANSTGRALRNLIHASDSIENAKRELDLWFSKNELHDYKTIKE